MSVKIFLLWNSKMLIDGGGDAAVATSLLEASNLVVLKVFIHSLPFSSSFSFMSCFTLIFLFCK